jgi:large subunit ribosomal protein L13
MKPKLYTTSAAKPADIQRKWYHVDARDLILGRVASRVAGLARGKHKPCFSPHIDCGDKVIVTNAEKVRLSGQKMEKKVYLRHTGYPGGQRSLTAQEKKDKKPASLFEHALMGMFPKNKLRNIWRKNVFIYVGEDHPHQAQNPEKITLNL